jgi:3-phenylpropionate/cinnamic acid dioxygenase small subunit
VYAEIAILFARYGRTLDDGDGDGFAAVFAKDGEFVRASDAYRGTDELRGFAAGRDPAGARHLTLNIVPAENADGTVSVVSDFLLVTGSPAAGATIAAVGRYDDTLVREDDALRIARRVVSRMV